MVNNRKWSLEFSAVPVLHQSRCFPQAFLSMSSICSGTTYGSLADYPGPLSFHSDTEITYLALKRDIKKRKINTTEAPLLLGGGRLSPIHIQKLLIKIGN